MFTTAVLASSIDYLIYALVGIVCLGIGGLVGWLVYKKIVENKIGNAKDAAKKVEEAAAEEAKKGVR